MAFDSLWLQEVDYPARIDRTVFDNIWTEGILGASSFEVTQSAPTAMTVRVAAGVAVITGDDQSNQGKYLVREVAPTTGVAIAAAPGTGSRHDLVVIKVRDTNAGGPAGDDSVIQVVTGTASPTPVDPAIPASALVLARVRVPAGTGVITNSLIDDLRVESYDAHNTIAPGSVDIADLSPSALGALSPTGMIAAFGGAVAPTGWLLCDGTSYPTATYPALSAVLAGAYDTSAGQSAPGAGNFRVPILKGRIPVGLDVGVPAFATLGSSGGQVAVTLTAAESGVASHTHPVSATGTSALNSVSHQHTFTTASDGSHSHTIDLIGQNLANLGEHKSASSSDYAAGEPDGNNFGAGARSGIVNSGGSHTHTGTTASNNANHTHGVTVTGNATAPVTASASSAHDNLQPYLTVNYIIKT
jgi:microcystin-dependent protein